MTARYFDGLQAQPHPVTLSVLHDRLLLTFPDGVKTETWSLAAIAAQATPDGAIILRQARDPARLVIDDPASLPPGLPSRRRPARPIGWAAALAALIVAIGLAGVIVHRAPDLLVPLVPVAWEAPLGAAMQATIASPAGPCTGAEGQRALDRLAATLAVQGSVKTPVQIAVIDTSLVNALTLPGNRILILRGLIGKAGDGDELAAVLAHEFGHLAHRDPAKQIIRQFGLRALATLLGWNGSGSGDIAQTLVSLAYGRQAETDADSFAIAALQGAGLRADGLARFFERLDTHGSTVPAFLSDHPATAERSERARQPATGAPAFTEPEWHAIQAICRKS